MGQLWRGALYPLRAFGFTWRHRLWPIAAAAVGVNVLLFVGLVVGAVYLIAPWLGKLDAYLEGSWWAFLGWLIWVAAVGAVVAGCALVIVLVGQVVASPLMDVLSEKTEAIVLGKRDEPFSWRQLLRGVWLACGDLFWGLLFLGVVSLALLPLGPLGPVLGFVFNALLLSQEFVGLPLTRRMVGYRGRWGAVWANRWVCLGFGAVAMGMLFTPGVNLLLLPVATVGGTMLYCDLVRGGRLTGV